MQLNKVDQHIKQMMLKYPVIMGSRMDALRQLFLITGNGYDWTADGCLDDGSNAEPVEAMDNSDLDRRQRELEEEEGKYPPSPSLNQMYASRRAQLKRQYAVRRLIESDIDLYAAEHVMGDNDKYGVEWLATFSPAFSAMGNAPYDALDPDWAAAAEETITIARTSIWRHLHMHSPFFDREKADPKWLSLYDELGVILDKLDATTGTKAKKARSLKALEEMLGRMASSAPAVASEPEA